MSTPSIFVIRINDGKNFNNTVLNSPTPIWGIKEFKSNGHHQGNFTNIYNDSQEKIVYLFCKYKESVNNGEIRYILKVPRGGISRVADLTQRMGWTPTIEQMFSNEWDVEVKIEKIYILSTPIIYKLYGAHTVHSLKDRPELLLILKEKLRQYLSQRSQETSQRAQEELRQREQELRQREQELRQREQELLRQYNEELEEINNL